ncbi:MAG: hypothetical protein ACI91G_001652 [Gammaproteobacteria bacterium]|jgi:hypothetical protein
MKLIVTALLLAASAIATAAPEPVRAVGFDACKTEDPASQCNATYEEASSQCERYFIKRTEALPLCLESALSRKNSCIEGVEKACAADPPKRVPKTDQ